MQHLSLTQLLALIPSGFKRNTKIFIRSPKGSQVRLAVKRNDPREGPRLVVQSPLFIRGEAVELIPRTEGKKEYLQINSLETKDFLLLDFGLVSRVEVRY